MAERVSTARILVDGMSCGSCEQRIEKAVSALEGVRRVGASASLSEVMVYYEPGRVGLALIHDAIRGAGYTVREESTAVARTTVAEAAVVPAARGFAGAPVYRFLGLIAVIAAVFLIIKYSVGFTFLPSVSQSMGYGLIFVVGLLTSLHCIAMCGGIVLSQGIKRNDDEPRQASEPRLARFTSGLVPSLLYNGGRVVSYTIIGGAVGALGSLFSLSTALKGAMPIVAGAFMLFLGVRMLGIFPWLSRLRIRFPGLGAGKVRAAASRRGPFVIGLLNGLMPCGPLQTMQVYALGTGSFFAGALSMFLFSLGTVPLLLGFGAISALLSAKFNRRMLKASGVLVMVLGLVMFTRGMSLFGIGLPSLPVGGQSAVAVATLAQRVPGGSHHRGVGAVPSLRRAEGDSRTVDRERDGGRPERLQQPAHGPSVRNPQGAGAGRQPHRVHPLEGRDRHLHLLDGHDLEQLQGDPRSLESDRERSLDPEAWRPHRFRLR